MVISEKRYLKLALNDPKGFWELHNGQPRQKPPMSVGHNDVGAVLHDALVVQLDRGQYRVRSNAGRLRRSAESYYIPDVCVVPIEILRPLFQQPRQLEVFRSPLPFVAEVWSPSTGDYDVESKIPEYQARGDAEIWRVHPFDRTVTTWRRQPDGSYVESTQTSGSIRLWALPEVVIDLDALFADF
jgi:Uma2 family endonuclease